MCRSSCVRGVSFQLRELREHECECGVQGSPILIDIGGTDLANTAKKHDHLKGVGNYGENDFKSKGMKRLNNLYPQIYNIDNLKLAYLKARKGKSRRKDVRNFSKNLDANILQLHDELKNKTYVISPYTTFIVKEPKERIVYRLPFRDRVVQHAAMNILEPVLVAMFTADTHSCIKGRGVHGACKAIRKALKNVPGTKYCLKIDIQKFYPSVDHAILKMQLRRKIKDNDLLWLLDSIIDSADGIPIGNYLSQYFSNLYLTGYDHWIKQDMRVINYIRYADDMAFLSGSKEYLHRLLAEIRRYLKVELNLTIKSNYQIYPIAARGLDMCGYVFYHYDYTRLRKRTKKSFARMVARRKNLPSIVAYNGWIKHCNGRHLLKKILHEPI